MTQPKRWQIAPTLTPQANENLAVFPTVLRQILFNRGRATDAEARAFLNAEANFNTDPFQMTGMDKAIACIQRAIEKKEAIAIYGDYDVDGVTATALLYEFSGHLEWKPDQESRTASTRGTASIRMHWMT